MFLYRKILIKKKSCLTLFLTISIFLLLENIISMGLERNIASAHMTAEECEKANNQSPFSIFSSVTPRQLEVEAENLMQQGFEMFQESRLRDSLQVSREGLELFCEIGNLSGAINTLNNIGIVYTELGRYRPAINALQQSLELLEKVVENQGMSDDINARKAAILNNIGQIFYLWGRYEQSLNSYQESLQIKQSLGDFLGEARTRINIGNVYKSLGNYPIALARLLSTMSKLN